jgi:hypothetical protein
MKPNISRTSFGSITVGGIEYEHDVFITLKGKVKKRKKKISKAIYGTSHTISEEEVRLVYEKGTEGLIVGSGQYGEAELSDEAVDYLQDKKCRIIVCPTQEAIREWNNARGNWIGLFHITC